MREGKGSKTNPFSVGLAIAGGLIIMWGFWFGPPNTFAGVFPMKFKMWASVIAVGLMPLAAISMLEG